MKNSVVRAGPQSWPRIGAILNYSTPAGHALLSGIAKYMGLHGPWTIRTHPRGGFASLDMDRPFIGEGVIAHVHAGNLSMLSGVTCPVVNISSLLSETEFPSVIPDNGAIGRLAAAHLLDRGFQSLGFCGFDGHGYSIARQHGAEEVARQRGASFHNYPNLESTVDRQSTDAYTELEQGNLLKWLAGLPKPVGVVCANDMRSRQVLAACQRGQVAVPEQVAIIGADNDELLCETAVPQLSSVAIDFHLLGVRAAELLHRLMRGEAAPDRPILLPPTGVIERQSTEVLAIDDQDVAAALRRIRETGLDSDMSVDRLLDDLSMSRRSLERRFLALLGRTPHQELIRVRLDMARRLLAETEMKMPQVAMRSGFSSAARLSVVFKREVGLTPTLYREQHRAHDAATSGSGLKP